MTAKNKKLAIPKKKTVAKPRPPLHDTPKRKRKKPKLRKPRLKIGGGTLTIERPKRGKGAILKFRKKF